MFKKEQRWSGIMQLLQKLLFLTFDIDVFFYKFRVSVSFTDLNPLGACIAEKQQSDEKFFKSENKMILVMRWQPR